MNHLMIFLIKLYKKVPTDMHNACRFTPTCSDYAIEAYEKYGFFKGTYLTIKRLLRCRPFGSYGYDPVPNKEDEMKKVLKVLLLTIGVFTLSGCVNKDSMEDITVYTSIYPIEYVTEKLYGNHSNVISMYPNDANPYEYKLTKKQIKDFSSGNLVIYNGLGNERDYIVDMINKNKNLKIIDSTARIEYTNSMDEIWINPSNLLTIAQNVRNGLKEYIDSNYLENEIDDNYNNLKLEISTIDAEMKEMVENATYKTIIISDNDFKFLEKYGFNIISIDKDTVTDKDLSDAKKLIANNSVSYIFAKKGESKTNSITDIVSTYPTVEVLEIDTLNTISNSDKADKKDYITIMYENIDKLKKELY